jgi:hypothetical protein
MQISTFVVSPPHHRKALTHAYRKKYVLIKIHKTHKIKIHPTMRKNLMFENFDVCMDVCLLWIFL